MKVLAIGECMAELAPTGVEGDFHMGFAGDTLNTAWYLAHLAPDAEVAYFTAFGQDALSQDALRFIAASGIDTSHVQVHPTRTIGLYLITLRDGERSFTYWRGQSAARTLADDPAALDAALAEADVVYVSGITLAILEDDARGRLLSALQAAREAGKSIAFDPNLRPRLWKDTASMCDAIMQGAKISDIALPSYDDEATFFGDADINATAQRYREAGATTVIVKNGEGDVLYLDGEEEGHVLVKPVSQVIDSTAAGDSFNAGILAGLLQGKSVPDGIRHACALAGMVVQSKGALVPIDLDLL